MMELALATPEIDVPAAEYLRLLGYPRGWVLSGRASDLAQQARDWYSENGRPWTYARQAERIEVADSTICVDGTAFHSRRLQRTLQDARAHSVIVAAVSAGVEVEEEARRLWLDDKPDEYFFLEVFGSAMVEHLTTMTGARLCAWAEQQGMAVLPHYSPGYPEWDVVEQLPLLELIRRKRTLPGALEALDSGALSPKKSQLAVFGLTRHTDRLRRLTELAPCENCSLPSCQYRRAPYVDANARYSVNARALKKWAGERLSLESQADGTIRALFRYDGTTCTNMGRPLTFQYEVTLGPKEDGYPIREQRCAPAPGDTGHTNMCRYIDNREHLMAAIDREKPLSGRPLNDVLAWQRPEGSAGCYCGPADREHKWGLVLETIHYALLRQEYER